jgi:hypothetical protein
MEIELVCNTPDEALFENVRANSHKYRNWVQSVPAHDGHAVIVGGGASLLQNLPAVQWRQGLGQHVFALNGAARFLKKVGITPEYQVILDARPENVAFVSDAGNHLIASQCDPCVFEHIKEPMLWHYAAEGIEEHIPPADGPGERLLLVGGGQTVGLATMALAYAMGYRKLHLFGFDSSHRHSLGHAYSQPMNDRDQLCKVTMGGKIFLSSLAMAQQAEQFPGVCNHLIDLGCIITVDGDGLIRAVVDEMRLTAQAA